MKRKKWDVSYKRESTSEAVWYSQDDELNCMHNFIDACDADEAVIIVIQNIAELMRCNCLKAIEEKSKLTIFDPLDHDLIECYYDFTAVEIEKTKNFEEELGEGLVLGFY